MHTTLRIGSVLNYLGVAALALLLPSAAQAAYQQDSQGLVSMEAEHASQSVVAPDGHEWQYVSTPTGASGGGAMRALPEDYVNRSSGYTTTSPRLDYEVNFAFSGTHHVWVRGNGPSGSSDSLHLGLNGSGALTTSGFSPYNSWVWVHAGTLTVSATGSQTLNLWMRESGLVVDKIVLTPDAGYTPSGTGPAESGTGGGGTGNTAPVLNPISNQTGREGELLSFTVTATDADGTTPSLSSNLNGLPSGASFVDNGNGSGTFNWTPAAGQANTYANVGFSASDGLASDSQTISIIVEAASSGGGGGSGSGFQQDSQGLVSMEAEHASQSVVAPDGHEWQYVSTPTGASGGGAMRALPEDFVNRSSGYTTTSPRLDYEVNFAFSGTHHVWVRGNGPSGSSDSLHLGLNGSGALTTSGFSPYNSWVWVHAGTLTVSATGSQTLNLWMRESGLVVDKIVLTPDAGYTPSGTGPAESGTGGGGTGNTAPVLNPISNQTGREGELLSFTVTATDADGTTPSLSSNLNGLPSGASFVDNGNGSGTFNWTPAAGQANTYANVGFSASDGLASDSQTISIIVEAASNGGGGGSGSGFQQDSQGLVSMEAEHASQSVVAPDGHEWQYVSTPTGASGGGAMRALPEDFVNRSSGYTTTSPRLDYEVNFAFSGTHHVWVRGNGPSGSSDSLHLGLNGSGALTTSGFSPYNSWVWVHAGTLTVSATGSQTLNLWMRESGLVVDKIVLTPDAGYTPSGTGPAESGTGGGGTGSLPISDDFDDGNASGWSTPFDEAGSASNWQVVNGGYRQLNDLLGGAGAALFNESYRQGSYTYLQSSTGLTDYRFSVDVTPLPNIGEDVGVLFRYQNGNSFYRLSLNSNNGFTRLEKKVAGLFSTLAVNARGYRTNEVLHIDIYVVGSLMQIMLNGDPLFAFRDTSLSSGGVGLYSRDAVSFDNVVLAETGTSPRVVVSKPLAHSVSPGGPLNLVAEAVVLNAPSGGAVQFELDGQSCGAVTQPYTNVYRATCANASVGEHDLVAILKNSSAVEVSRDTNVRVGVGSTGLSSRALLAVGDSLTNGYGDNYAADNLSQDGRTITFRGWASMLGDQLTASSGYPNLVFNEGIVGDKTSDVYQKRLASLLERHGNVDTALVLLGTNDSNVYGGLPSGAGCTGAACNGTFKGNMIGIINSLQSQGLNVVVSLMPPTFGEQTGSNPYANPLTGARTVNVQALNDVIVNELATLPGVKLGADLFSCFLSSTVNRFSLYSDNLHLNGLGNQMVAALMTDALTGPDVIPGSLCAAPIYIVENLLPYRYKQNLIEAGDTVYWDNAGIKLVASSSEIQDTIWVMTADGDKNNTSANLVSFDVGSQPVDVYVAYDANATPPTWLTSTYTSTGQTVTLSGAASSVLSLYKRTGVTGTVQLGGNKATGADGALVNYLVMVKQ